MTTRRNRPANRWGCKPEEDVCVEHDLPLECRHGCRYSKEHQCKDAHLKDKTVEDLRNIVINFNGGAYLDALIFDELARRLEEAQKQIVAQQAETNTRTAWLLERNSMWGVEWFCAGDKRWTKDASKAMQFPCKASAVEMWEHLHVACGNPKPVFPYEREGGGEWDYLHDVTEHMFISSDAAHDAEIAAKVLEEGSAICDEMILYTGYDCSIALRNRAAEYRAKAGRKE